MRGIIDGVINYYKWHLNPRIRLVAKHLKHNGGRFGSLIVCGPRNADQKGG